MVSNHEQPVTQTFKVSMYEEAKENNGNKKEKKKY